MMTTTQTMKRTLLLITALAALVAASLMMAAGPAHADTTFTVDTTGDVGDPALNGVCDSDLLGGVSCTLRAAIQEANHTPGADTIEFDIPDDPNVPGPEVKTIKPTSQLPNKGSEVTIDGYTQGSSTPSTDDDATENTLAKGTNARLMIELDGSDATGGSPTGW